MKMPRNRKMTYQEQINLYMKNLGCTEEEAKDIIKTDAMIDDGKKSPYDNLSKEQEKIVKNVTTPHVQNKKTNNDQRGKSKPKIDVEKAEIIAELCEMLKENEYLMLKNIEIINKSRQIAFETAEDRFELTLVKKKKAKKE